MIIVKYFKIHMWGDCYVADDDYMNIISISKNEVCVFADERIDFDGAYKEINIKMGFSFRKRKATM